LRRVLQHDPPEDGFRTGGARDLAGHDEDVSGLLERPEEFGAERPGANRIAPSSPMKGAAVGASDL
jgi:hypothetical protein